MTTNEMQKSSEQQVELIRVPPKNHKRNYIICSIS